MNSDRAPAYLRCALALAWLVLAGERIAAGAYGEAAMIIPMLAFNARTLAQINLQGWGKPRVSKQHIYWTDATLTPILLMVGPYSISKGYTRTGGCEIFLGLMCLWGVVKNWTEGSRP